MKFIIFISTLSLFLAAAVSQDDYVKPCKDGLKSFHPIDHVFLRQLSVAKPELFHGVSFDKILESFSVQDTYPKHLFLDELLVDYRQLLTQATKITKSSTLPEIDWCHWYDFCIEVNPETGAKWCFNFTVTHVSKESRMVGTQTISSKTDVTPTSFKNVFSVPHFRWDSPDWLFAYHDIGGESLYLLGYHMIVNNLTIVTSADFEYVNGVGIQLSNLDINLDIQNYITIQDHFWYSWESDMKDNPPIEYDNAESTLYIFDYWKEEYLTETLHQINCLLSNSKSNPETCFPEEDSDYNAYSKFLIIELMQSMGIECS